MKRIIFILMMFLSVNCFAGDYIDVQPSAYTYKLTYDSVYLWLSGANANQNVNIGNWDFSAGTLYATDTGTSVFNDQVDIETLSLAGGSITDSTGAISFGNENLTTTGKTTIGNFNISSPTVPATAASAGTTGDIAWDSSYIYVCVGVNTWKRVAIATWISANFFLLKEDGGFLLLEIGDKIIL